MKILAIGIFMFGNVLCATPTIDSSLDKLFEAVPRNHAIEYDGTIYEVDMRSLLEHTAAIESNYGLDRYRNKHAISPFQYEKTTARWSLSVGKELVSYLEERLGHKIEYGSVEHGAYVAYVIYMTKLRYHRGWLDQFNVGGELDWKMYKILYNSIDGASTYDKWLFRKEQLRNRRD